MKLLRIHPQDRIWLRDRLRAHFYCTLGLGALCLIIRIQPSGPIDTGRSIAKAGVTNTAYASSAAGASSGTTGSAKRLPDQVRGIDDHFAVAPTGWRRTSNGWEHVSTWPGFGADSIPNINEVIAEQRQREPKWARTVLDCICKIPPLTVAMLQMTAVAAIAFVSDYSRRTEQ